MKLLLVSCAALVMIFISFRLFVAIQDRSYQESLNDLIRGTVAESRIPLKYSVEAPIAREIEGFISKNMLLSEIELVDNSFGLYTYRLIFNVEGNAQIDVIIDVTRGGIFQDGCAVVGFRSGEMNTQANH